MEIPFLTLLAVKEKKRLREEGLVNKLNSHVTIVYVSI